MSGKAIKLSADVVEEARRYAETFSRSLPKQIEYWMRIGKTMEENPDLPYSFVKEMMLSRLEGAEGNVTPYVFEDDEKQ